MVFAPGQPFRILLGRVALVLKGFPSEAASLSELIGKAVDTEMADLAGNMVSTPTMHNMVMAETSPVSWRDTPRPHASTTTDTCTRAWTLLRSIMPQPDADGDSGQSKCQQR